MGCRHYFVVDRFEDLVDEGDSRSSSRAHEHENFRLVSQQSGNPDTLKSMSTSSNGVDEPVGCPITTGLSVLSRSASASLSVSLSFSERSTNKLVFSQSREKRVSISWALERDVCSVTTGRPVPKIGLGFGWVGWLVVFCLSSNFWTHHPSISQGNLRRRSRWLIYFFVYHFSSFHPNNFRDTISWECFVKNDSVRSCLIEFQSFLQSKVDVDPIHSVLMFLPCFVHVLRKTRCVHVDRFRILVFLIQWIHRQKEYCLSFAQILTSWYRSWIDDGMLIDCTSNVIMYVKQSSGIKTLSCNEGLMRLRPEWPWRAWRYKIAPENSVKYWYLFLFPPPLAMGFLPLFVRPMMAIQEFFLKIVFDSPEFNRSIIFSMYLSSMTKKMNQILRYFIIGEWIFSWFNIGPNSFPNCYSSCGWAGRSTSLWFCFGLWSACKSTCIRF